jgi:hypothetical protein
VIPEEDFEARFWIWNQSWNPILRRERILFPTCGSITWNEVRFLKLDVTCRKVDPQFQEIPGMIPVELIPCCILESAFL